MEWYYWVNGKWITTNELSSLIGITRQHTIYVQ